MNEESQRRKILRFLKGKGNKDVDVFCLYQWVERCHYHGWWKLGIQLGTAIPPNSLKEDYIKRVNYLLRECRNNLNKSWTKENISEAPIIWGVVRNIATKGTRERLELQIFDKYDEWLPSEKVGVIGLVFDDQIYWSQISHVSNRSLWHFLMNWIPEHNRPMKQTKVLKHHGFTDNNPIKLRVVKPGSIYVLDRKQ